MSCEFINPVNYQGNPPITGEPFAFRTSSCDISPLASLSAQPNTPATTSAQISFSPDLNFAFATSFYIVIVLLALILFFLAIDFGRKALKI